MKTLILLVCVGILMAQDSAILQENNNVKNSDSTSEINSDFITADSTQNPMLINAIKSDIERRFLNFYKNYNITINFLDITPLVERNLAKFEVEKIIFDNRDLKKTSGNFEVHLKHNERKKKVFFSFQIDAVIDSVNATSSIKSGEVIDKNNTNITQIPLTKNMTLPVSAEILDEYEAKSFIVGGSIITASKITPKIIVRKGDILNIHYKNNDISITFSVKAMQDGAKNQNIRSQNTQSGKELNIIITDSKNGTLANTH